jgi:hypothetical protein
MEVLGSIRMASGSPLAPMNLVMMVMVPTFAVFNFSGLMVVKCRESGEKRWPSIIYIRTNAR